MFKVMNLSPGDPGYCHWWRSVSLCFCYEFIFKMMIECFSLLILQMNSQKMAISPVHEHVHWAPERWTAFQNLFFYKTNNKIVVIKNHIHKYGFQFKSYFNFKYKYIRTWNHFKAHNDACKKTYILMTHSVSYTKT